ncbi:MAG: endosialidase [Lachnospiraceae bacterium]|nr:endosialidase [Lachnospiraceae bacterium]
MASAEQLLFEEADGSLSFGDHTLAQKAKVEDFPYQGDLLKVKTYQTMTKLEKNGMFVYESVPGTSVSHFKENSDGVDFKVTGVGDAQITIGLEDDQEYKVSLNGQSAGFVKTNLGGKLNISVELSETEAVDVLIKKC